MPLLIQHAHPNAMPAAAIAARYLVPRRARCEAAAPKKNLQILPATLALFQPARTFRAQRIHAAAGALIAISTGANVVDHRFVLVFRTDELAAPVLLRTIFGRRFDALALLVVKALLARRFIVLVSPLRCQHAVRMPGFPYSVAQAHLVRLLKDQ